MVVLSPRFRHVAALLRSFYQTGMTDICASRPSKAASTKFQAKHGEEDQASNERIRNTCELDVDRMRWDSGRIMTTQAVCGIEEPILKPFMRRNRFSDSISAFIGVQFLRGTALTAYIETLLPQNLMGETSDYEELAIFPGFHYS